jgi:Fe-S-cluster containining protein
MKSKTCSCTCDGCIEACRIKPGWFIPIQIPELLKYFKVKTIKGLIEIGKFAIDFWAGDEEDILILAPNIKNNPSEMYPYDPTGKCVFLKNDRCKIYNIRPYECAVMIHGVGQNIMHRRHKQVMNLWKRSKYQKYLSDRYYDLIPEPLSLLEMMLIGLRDLF